MEWKLYLVFSILICIVSITTGSLTEDETTTVSSLYVNHFTEDYFEHEATTPSSHAEIHQNPDDYVDITTSTTTAGPAALVLLSSEEYDTPDNSSETSDSFEDNSTDHQNSSKVKTARLPVVHQTVNLPYVRTSPSPFVQQTTPQTFPNAITSASPLVQQATSHNSQNVVTSPSPPIQQTLTPQNLPNSVSSPSPIVQTATPQNLPNVLTSPSPIVQHANKPHPNAQKHPKKHDNKDHSKPKPNSAKKTNQRKDGHKKPSQHKPSKNHLANKTAPKNPTGFPSHFHRFHPTHPSFFNSHHQVKTTDLQSTPADNQGTTTPPHVKHPAPPKNKKPKGKPKGNPHHAPSNVHNQATTISPHQNPAHPPKSKPKGKSFSNAHHPLATHPKSTAQHPTHPPPKKPKGRTLPKSHPITTALPHMAGSQTTPPSNLNVTDKDLKGFADCRKELCQEFCRSKTFICDKNVKQLCLCQARYFIAVEIPENISMTVPDLSNGLELSCSHACIGKMAYTRIVTTNSDGAKHCICLTEQMTPTGITLCDPLDYHNACKDICKTETALCTFNGLCLCGRNWDQFYNQSVPHVRNEMLFDLMDCSSRCAMYHHDYVERIYDPSPDLLAAHDMTRIRFLSKYCLCGPEIVADLYNETKALVAQGFQACSGLKCKQRCGMREAKCEPKFKRACLCHRQNIFIGHHLWSRLPSPKESKCIEVCESNGLKARVIEKNPLLDPTAEKYLPVYRNSTYAYQIEGKFCHCITVELNMNIFRPCTDEVCQWLCGHSAALCDLETRRDCICNTHKMIGGLGRVPEPGEAACENSCRHLLTDAKIVDVVWEAKDKEGWGVTKSKYCGCLRQVTLAGITHCEGGKNDICPQLCNNPKGFCAREKYCECGTQPKSFALDHGPIRLPNSEEEQECGELCRSWMWPIAEDADHLPYIYDFERVNCSSTNVCPKVDTTPWKEGSKTSSTKFTEYSHISFSKDDEHFLKYKRYCLCGKSSTIHHSPGTRVLLHMSPERAPQDMECIGNHKCSTLGNTIYIRENND